MEDPRSEDAVQRLAVDEACNLLAVGDSRGHLHLYVTHAEGKKTLEQASELAPSRAREREREERG